MTSTRERAANYAILGLFALTVLLPVAYLLRTALTAPGAGGGLTSLRLGNFSRAWTDAGLSGFIASSAIIATAAVIATTFLSVLAGYAFGILGVAGGRLLFPLVLAGIMIPLEAIIVPLYFNFRTLNLTDSYLGLILAHTGLSVSFGTFWMRSTFKSLPRGLVEAGEMDGANSWELLWRVLVPVARPAMVTLALLVFTWTWNDYFLALVLTSNPDVQPATLALGTFQGRYLTQTNLLAAAAVLVSTPVVILYMLFQRQFIGGVLAGALKE